MIRRKIIAGNWKMNNNTFEGERLINEIKNYQFSKDVRVIVSPPYTQLSFISQKLKNSNIEVASQNMHFASVSYTHLTLPTKA